MVSAKYLLLALALCPVMAAASDFSNARVKIESIEPNINYSSFCSEQPSGADKVACRMKSYPTVGFLVCKTNSVDGASCEDVVNIELGNLATVKRKNLSLIAFDPPALGPVQCAASTTKDCYCYLVGWVTGGTFTNIDHAITDNNIAVLANEIVTYTTPSKLSATKSDLNKIIAYMTSNSKYSQICDLQGFYLKNGGFLISDVPQIINDSRTKPDCGDEYPSYDEQLAGLKDLVAKLKP